MNGFDLMVMRRRAGIAQWKAAQEVGIAPQYLCHAERGRRDLEPEAERKLVTLYSRLMGTSAGGQESSQVGHKD